MNLTVPQLSLVVLVGVSGSGKSTFARAHFKSTEVISSDFCRGLVADDENDQSATPAAFELLHYIAGKRLAAGRLTVVDATNVQPDARRQLVALAREHDVLPVAIVLDVPEGVCVARNAARPDRDFGARVIRRQRDQLRRGLKGLKREGFRYVHVLDGVAEVDAAEITRTRLYNDLRHEAGPFDVVGDVHGCRAELEQLLAGELGYVLSRDAQGRAVGAAHPEGRRVIFLGDLVDRGPDTPGVLRLAMGMVAEGSALAVCGNHEAKLLRALHGDKVRVNHGLAESLEQIEAEPAEFTARVVAFLDGLISHYVLDEGRLVVSHAGLIERYHGRTSGRVREFCLYGQTTGETDEYGLPVRYPWAEEYRGKAMVLYGHTPVPATEWLNNTLCLDTGCVFGGRLSALRYPERAVVSVPAFGVHYLPRKPFPAAIPTGLAGPAGLAGLAGPAGPAAASAAAVREAVRAAGILDIGDVTGSRVIETGYLPRVGIREAHAAAALEVMSRFAIDPRSLLYLPPTMAPVATAADGDLLEHPSAAFESYRADGVSSVVCEEKHMGSRAVLLVSRGDAVLGNADLGNADLGNAVLGNADLGNAVLGNVDLGNAVLGDAVLGNAAWTRTGRAFFGPSLTESLTSRVRACAEKAGLFEELGTSWLLFDCELLPWNVKAGQLLRDQYAAVGAAARAALPAAVAAIERFTARGLDDGGSLDGGSIARGSLDGGSIARGLLDRTRAHAANAEAFTAAYLRYCWQTDGLDGVRLAPFQLLASEGAVHHERPHAWHLDVADRLVAADPVLLAATRRLFVDTSDPSSLAAGVTWWEDLTGAGGEGMVVKPAAGLVRGPKGIVQPGLKVRGREYLRIIYGPDYTAPENLARLRNRALGHKRSLALREYALGLEALDRVARGEPLWRVHECVFGVLALESEPVDPRL